MALRPLAARITPARVNACPGSAAVCLMTPEGMPLLILGTSAKTSSRCSARIL